MSDPGGACPKCQTNSWVLNAHPQFRDVLMDVCVQCGYEERSRVKPRYQSITMPRRAPAASSTESRQL